MVEINRRHPVLTSVLPKCAIMHAHVYTHSHRAQVFMEKVCTPAKSIETKMYLKSCTSPQGAELKPVVQVAEANLS